MNNYLYDENRVRLNWVRSRSGEMYNWLFIPGGPGASSDYLKGLVELLPITGNIFLVDFPGNGDYLAEEFYEYDKWFEYFLELVRRFENPIVVGHSFGGMLPLLFPELEDVLKGYVILNSAPTLWLEAAAKFAFEHQLPNLMPQMQAFTLNPNPETFRVALQACMPYYFPDFSIEAGAKLLENVAFAYQPAVWWQRKAMQMAFDANWIPKKVQTLIVGGEYDAITPFSLFAADKRFDRDNIQKIFIESAGHMPWLEQPEIIKASFEAFMKSLKA